MHFLRPTNVVNMADRLDRERGEWRREQIIRHYDAVVEHAEDVRMKTEWLDRMSSDEDVPEIAFDDVSWWLPAMVITLLLCALGLSAWVWLV